MTRPEIIRADTIDLQDRIAPSAQDHSYAKGTTALQRHSNSSSYLGPSENSHYSFTHQTETIRGVAADTAQDRRLSWTDSNLTDLQLGGSDLAADIASTLNHQHSLHSTQQSTNMTTLQQQDALAVAQNGGFSADNSEEDVEDTDDGLDDDDMMDKISSSPSIEDGGYPTFLNVPSRLAFLDMQAACARAGFEAAESPEAQHVASLPANTENASPHVPGGQGICYSCKAPYAESIASDVDVDVDEDEYDAREANLLTCRRNRSYTMANGNVHEVVSSLMTDTHPSRHEEFFDGDDEGMTIPYFESGDEGSDAGSSASDIETIDARYVLSG